MGIKLSCYKLYHHVQADSNLLGPDDDPFAVDSRPAFVPSSKEINKSIDIDLRETDTIWMFILPGTCKEIEGDEDVQRTKKRKPAVVCFYIFRKYNILMFIDDLYCSTGLLLM